MAMRKISIGVALIWMAAIVLTVVAVAQGAERDYRGENTAEIIFNEQGEAVNGETGIFFNRKKTPEKEEPRTEPYDPNTAPEFDFPEDEVAPTDSTERRSIMDIFSRIDFDNLFGLVVPLLASFGGFKIGTSDPSIKMLLTVISKIKKDKFGEIVDSITKPPVPTPDPEPVSSE